MVGLTIAPPVGGRQQLLHTLLGTLMVLMVLSFFVALLLPAVGIDYELGGAWRGVLPQKNTLGAISGLCMVLCVKESRNHYYPRWLCYVGVLFSLFMLVMSKSSTATLVAVMGIAIYLLSRRRYFKDQYDARRLLLILFMLLLLGLHLFYVTEARLPRWDELFAPVGALFNKSSDLTGRTDIWRMVLLEIDKHPDFGLGYGAFWLGEGSLSQSIIDALHWVPLQAHNGYLDILNELGIVGFCIMLGVFVMHIWSLIKLTPIDREEAAIHWGILFLILISNLSESEVFRGVLFQNIFFLYSSTSISARLSLHRMAQGNMHNHKRQASS